MKTKIGLLTIGQSPRSDLVSILGEAMGPRYDFVEAGALDGFTKSQILALEVKPDDYILATRLRDGSEVKVAKRVLLPYLQEKIHELEAKRVKVTLIMCTGKFPKFESKGLVVTPSEILHGVIEASLKRGRLGVVFPAREQVAYAEKEFGREGVEIYSDYYSPYEGGDVGELCSRLKAQRLDLIFLNCFGYLSSVRAAVLEATGIPTIQSNTLIAKVLSDLV